MSGNRKNIKRLALYLRDNPHDSFTKFALALELLKNNQADKALQLFESIHQTDPGYLGTYYHLGKLYQEKNRFREAEICFRDGMEIARAKNEQRTLSELSEALVTLKEDEEEYDKS